MVPTEATTAIRSVNQSSEPSYPPPLTTPTVTQESYTSNSFNSNYPPSSELSITHKVTSAAGIVERVRAVKNDMAIGLLAAWSHPRREREINDTLLQSLRSLPKEDAIGIVSELKQKSKKFVKGKHGNQLDMPAQIQTLDTQKHIDTRILQAML